MADAFAQPQNRGPQYFTICSMTPANLIQLFALAAIWGASFLFMRIAAPALGPILLTELRLLFAAGFLALAAAAWRQPLDAHRHWRVYLVLGLFNSALPFLLLSFAATRLSASLMSIINAMAPVFAAVVAAIWLRESLSVRTLTGLLAGVSGVAILVGYDEHALQSKLAVAAALAASLCYGIGSVYTRTIVKPPPSLAMAHGSMWAGLPGRAVVAAGAIRAATTSNAGYLAGGSRARRRL